jgi:glutamate/tyrosine decarboxylase-like PLP-dependent enzyme
MSVDGTEMEEVLRAALKASLQWLEGLSNAPVAPRSGEAPDPVPLPETGVGAAVAIRELEARARERAMGSTGPRYFHYVVGGATPAALGADWYASALDQVASSALGSPLAVDLEELATQWLIELFDLGAPEDWTGQFTTGATMASFVGLSAARQWWGMAHGVDVAEEGLAGLPRPVVLTGGYVHASVVKSLAMVGVGRRSIETFTADNRGSVDLAAFAARLESLPTSSGPAIVVATAGEVNAGRFDPIDELADLCRLHGAWLHVDGAFGLFARASSDPETRARCRGIERADSIASDAHKWLNVPYDCGFAFVRERSLLAKSFRMVADYLPKTPQGATRRRVPANLGPECSRRARALPVFATLLASGRSGVAAMVDKHLRLAKYLAEQVAAHDDLELVDEPHLNVVPFRLAPRGVRKRDLDALNEEAAAQVLADGKVYVGTTRYRSRVIFRPAISNWRTEEADLDHLVAAILEAGLQCRNERTEFG